MTGLYEDYRLPAHLVRAAPAQSAPARRVGWAQILERWPLVVADLGRLAGIDLTDPAVWQRPWAPIRAQILALPHEPTSRLRRALGGD